jgi:hypothetical protein
MRKNRCTIKLIDHRLLISQFNPSIMASIFDLHLPIQSVIITSKLASSFEIGEFILLYVRRLSCSGLDYIMLLWRGILALWYVIFDELDWIMDYTNMYVECLTLFSIIIYFLLVICVVLLRLQEWFSFKKKYWSVTAICFVLYIFGERDITESRFRYIIINDLSEDEHFDWYNLLINFNDDA